MIVKFYEMSCDVCGCAEHFNFSVRDAIATARRSGWIITKDGKHIDSRECYKKYLENKKK
jgi:hypothetical protein